MGYVVTLLLSLSMHVGWISSEARAFTGMPSSHHPILSVSSSTTEPWWPTLCLSSGTADNEHTTEEEEEEEEEPPPTPTLTNIGKAEMTAILAHLENGTGDTNYVVLDVRGVDEIRMGTGKMSNHVHILPLPEITMRAALDMDATTFVTEFNFPKPSTENDTLVFTCQMGGRSQQAAQVAATSGYTTILNYTGGADDWFGGEFVYT